MNSVAPVVSLTYWPVTSCLNFSTAALSFTCCDAQPASTANAVHAAMAAAQREKFLMTTLSSVIGAPLCLIPGAEREKFLEQIGIAHARGERRLREVFVGREVGIRIRLDDVDLSVGRQSIVDARAARESEAAIDAA